MHYKSLYSLRFKYVRAYVVIFARGRKYAVQISLEIPMEISRYKSVSGVAYLETSAIRHHATQFNYIFSDEFVQKEQSRMR